MEYLWSFPIGFCIQKFEGVFAENILKLRMISFWIVSVVRLLCFWTNKQKVSNVPKLLIQDGKNKLFNWLPPVSFRKCWFTVLRLYFTPVKRHLEIGYRNISCWRWRVIASSTRGEPKTSSSILFHYPLDLTTGLNSWWIMNSQCLPLHPGSSLIKKSLYCNKQLLWLPRSNKPSPIVWPPTVGRLRLSCLIDCVLFLLFVFYRLAFSDRCARKRVCTMNEDVWAVGGRVCSWSRRGRDFSMKDSPANSEWAGE